MRGAPTDLGNKLRRKLKDGLTGPEQTRLIAAAHALDRASATIEEPGGVSAYVVALNGAETALREVSEAAAARAMRAE